MDQHWEQTHKAGLPPGTLIYTGIRTNVDVEFELYSYSGHSLESKSSSNLTDVLEHYRSGKVNWIDLTGIHHIPSVEELGKKFEIHPLVLEDVLNVHQMPKSEGFGDQLFVTMKMLRGGKTKRKFTEEQISFLLGSEYLISFQEMRGDVFDPLRERLKVDGTRIRKMGADYLLYRLIDITVDHYYGYVDRIFQRAQKLETALIDMPNVNRTREILRLRKTAMRLRRIIHPLREAVNHINTAGQSLIHNETVQYFNDVTDHLQHISQSIVEAEELLRGCMDLQMTNQNNNLNNVMKVLTVVSTTFIPLTFIAGIYGMNFQYMPELQKPWAYPVVLILMALIAVGMIAFFKRKGWF